MCNLGQFEVLVYRTLAAEIQTCLHQASQGERIVIPILEQAQEEKVHTYNICF